ncbi:hypothetical protein [Nocardia asiatica]|uniref:hypothetical protein n=1 Tax=Nocardia asiatica TaxID=209252 RepID=UPI002457C518|nr:hypothetical protein [Nocardia asiatica]
MTGIGFIRPTTVTTRTGPANRLLMGGNGEWRNVPVLFEVPDNEAADHVRARSFLVDRVEMVNLDQPTRGLEIRFMDQSVSPVRIDVDEVVTVHHVEFLAH